MHYPQKKVLVAMSGGVDSSTTAALLKDKGYYVVGASMQLWSDDNNNNTLSSTVKEARNAAKQLDIPFYVFDFREVFKKEVVGYFIDQYIKGKTPNPCVICNQQIKFDALLEKAQEMGMDFLSTGHYAKIVFDFVEDCYLLKKAYDASKDQSYFLYGLTQKKLSKLLLPLGDYTKENVRKIAGKKGLISAEKFESQEVCFISDNNYRSFLVKNADDRMPPPGPFLDISGNRLGTHRGIPFYTVGQRKGLGLSLGYPAYVVDIKKEENVVIIGSEKDVFFNGLITEKNNFILFEKLSKPLKADVKVRYKADPKPAAVTPLKDGEVQVDFEEPVKAVAPGQAAVYYINDTVIGGGIIKSNF